MRRELFPPQMGLKWRVAGYHRPVLYICRELDSLEYRIAVGIKCALTLT